MSEETLREKAQLLREVIHPEAKEQLATFDLRDVEAALADLATYRAEAGALREALGWVQLWLLERKTRLGPVDEAFSSTPLSAAYAERVRRLEVVLVKADNLLCRSQVPPATYEPRVHMDEWRELWDAVHAAYEGERDE